MGNLRFIERLHELLNLFRPHGHAEQCADFEHAAARQRTQAAFQRHDSPFCGNDRVQGVALKLSGRGAGRERGAGRVRLRADRFGRRHAGRDDRAEKRRQRNEHGGEQLRRDRNDRGQKKRRDADRRDDAP